MKSLRQSARVAGVASPLQVRNLALRVGLVLPPVPNIAGRGAPPISLTQLMQIMEARPPGLAEEVRFSQIVTTPPGTALGGAVDVTLRSNGTYKVHFHMHNRKGIP